MTGIPREMIDVDDSPSTIYHEDGSVTYHDGMRVWYRGGIIHRDDGPALTTRFGKKYWYRDGRYHRDDGPAITDDRNGAKYWYRDGKLYDIVVMWRTGTGHNIIFNQKRIDLSPYPSAKWSIMDDQFDAQYEISDQDLTIIRLSHMVFDHA